MSCSCFMCIDIILSELLFHAVQQLLGSDSVMCLCTGLTLQCFSSKQGGQLRLVPDSTF